MMKLVSSRLSLLLLCAAAAAACDDGSGSGGDADAGETTDPASDGDGLDPAGDRDVQADDAALDDGGTDVDPDSILPPPEACPLPVELVDTSSPDRVVGTGSPESCTEAAFTEALAAGGIIVFDCGGDPYTLTVTSEKEVTQDTVIDGEGVITLSGGGTSRILAVHSSFERETPSLTVQRLSFVDGVRTGSGETTEDGGGAIYRLGGTLTVIDCTFSGNRCPPEGQDVAGGAVYSIGEGLTTIVGSVFTGNSCSNGGAVGNLHNQLTIVNSSVTGNSATGTGGNPGNGGNGGGIYIDGVGQTVILCGSTVSGNNGNAYGGGIFRVSNDGTGSMTVDRCSFDGNAIPDRSPSMAGGLYLQGMVITMTGTTISNNACTSAAGMFVGPTTPSVDLVNVTIAGNTALSGLAGGIAFDSGVSGTVTNCTFANNRAPGEVAFAAATTGGESVTVRNTLFSGHEAGNEWNPLTCRVQHVEGGGNIQWPDDSYTLCTEDILVADPLLGPLQDNGGPTLTLMPGAGSPAVGRGTGCPAVDQRGEPRGEPCTSGAVEAD